MNNPLSILVIVFGLIMLGLCYGESVKDKAKYQCIQEVAKIQSVDKARELCK